VSLFLHCPSVQCWWVRGDEARLSAGTGQEGSGCSGGAPPPPPSPLSGRGAAPSGREGAEHVAWERQSTRSGRGARALGVSERRSAVPLP